MYLDATTAGMAALSLHCRLLGLKLLLLSTDCGCLPLQLAGVTDKSKNAKEQGILLEDDVSAMLAGCCTACRHDTPSCPLSMSRTPLTC